MNTYPRIPEKSSNCFTYILLVIDAIGSILLNFLALFGLVEFQLIQIPIFILTLVKTIGVYNSFVCLKSPEKVKPNRSCYLFFSAVSSSVNIIVFIPCLLLYLSVIFGNIRDNKEYKLLQYALYFQK